eukprot:9457792-Pyramimonas_sp.AAC.1
MFLADFAAACPSAAISWLLRALVLMQVHFGSLVSLRRFTLENMVHICFGGKRHGRIRLNRGARQGGPSSMLLRIGARPVHPMDQLTHS